MRTQLAWVLLRLLTLLRLARIAWHRLIGRFTGLAWLAGGTALLGGCGRVTR